MLIDDQDKFNDYMENLNEIEEQNKKDKQLT